MSCHWSCRVLALLLLLLLLLQCCCDGLNSDGVFLLSFKYGVLDDPLFVLQNWNYSDDTPCSWRGVTCGSDGATVTALSLPDSLLMGSVSSDLGLIQSLQFVDLSNNSFNGSLPLSLFNNSMLRFLDLSENLISDEVPAAVSRLGNLQVLNLSGNALFGEFPSDLANLGNLTVISLKNNYISGELPGRFGTVEVLDLSSNLINGSLPFDFGGDSLRYFNISYNRLSGEIPPDFAHKIPANATIDLSFNNFTGEVPVSDVFMNQEANSFAGNRQLCGEITKTACPIPSSPASLPPAIAAMPIDPSTPETTSPEKESGTGLKSSTIVAIVLGDVVGLAILCLLFFYVYHLKKKNKTDETHLKNESNLAKDSWSTSSSESRGFSRWSCLRKKEYPEEGNSEQVSIGSISGRRDTTEEGGEGNKRGTLVTVDGGEKELELETLLKASAYILGATGSSITYKAVLEDGTAFAVRRIGDGGVEKYKDFENQIRVVAKLVHPNLVRVRGFYWGVDEKLIIYEFVPNGSLANARHRKVGSSPCHLPWEARLRIAKGVARGLAYLHDKKHVHANLRPSNILLGYNMEPKIGDFGLEKVLFGDSTYKTGSSTRNFGSKRSTASRDSFQDFVTGPSPGPSPSPSSISGVSPYLAPESLRSLKPTPKWDVYSFGVILLELLTGKIVVLDELGQGLELAVDDKSRALRMADMAIRVDVEGREDALLSFFKLGYTCASPTPQKRPSMKEALQVLEKFPTISTSSHYYGL
ncbi:putative LRR receptor-like serine/threonine-protein kinase [Cucurbita argyrosperma subsp. argyrosperma]|nr:putative LRR receptor-like serine/threonine-protein kinase [Cucurbita argyrosperma subsp. argyrosperma]